MDANRNANRYAGSYTAAGARQCPEQIDRTRNSRGYAARAYLDDRERNNRVGQQGRNTGSCCVGPNANCDLHNNADVAYELAHPGRHCYTWSDCDKLAYAHAYINTYTDASAYSHADR